MEIYRSFKDTIRELGLRDEMMVVRTGCLKHCSRGTVVTVWPYNYWYQQVTLDDVREIVESSARPQGEEVERLRMPDIPWE